VFETLLHIIDDGTVPDKTGRSGDEKHKPLDRPHHMAKHSKLEAT